MNILIWNLNQIKSQSMFNSFCHTVSYEYKCSNGNVIPSLVWMFSKMLLNKRGAQENVEKIISFSRPIGSILLGNCFRSSYANVIQTLNRIDFHSRKNPLKESTDSARYYDRIDHSGNVFRDQRMYYLLPLHHKWHPKDSPRRSRLMFYLSIVKVVTVFFSIVIWAE